jgi:hypothetical protein
MSTPPTIRLHLLVAREAPRVLIIRRGPSRVYHLALWNVLWHKVELRHFRSTTFLQYKSVLKHAGIVAPHALGGVSAHSYDPDRDIWELALPHGETP